MLKKISTFLLYEEKQTYIKKNVLVIFQICMLLWLTTSYHVYLGNYLQVFRDSILLVFIMVMWLLIKKYDKYFPNIACLVLLPMLIYTIGDGLFYDELVELYWLHPAMVLFFLIAPLRLAMFCSAVLCIVILFLSRDLITKVMLYNLAVSLATLYIASTFAFKNMYRQYDSLENQANRDTLTNLLNRSLLSEKLQYSIQCCKKNNNCLLPIIFYIDIDHFKKINDTYGHQTGDKVLVDFSELLNKHFYKNATVFRMGGEEFIVLLNNKSLAISLQLAEVFRQLVEQANILPNGENITVSIGVSVYKENENWNYWLKRADDAMYQAKQKGRNQVVVND